MGLVVRDPRWRGIQHKGAGQRSIFLVGRLRPQKSRGPHSLAWDRRPFPCSQVPGQCPDPIVTFPWGKTHRCLETDASILFFTKSSLRAPI